MGNSFDQNKVIIFYIRKFKNGKFGKLQKMNVENMDQAIDIINSRSPKSEYYLFNNLAEFASFSNRQQMQRLQKKQLKLKKNKTMKNKYCSCNCHCKENEQIINSLSANGLKIFNFLIQTYKGYTADCLIQQFKLDKNTDKPYYVIYSYENYTCGEFASKEDILEYINATILDREDCKVSITEVETLKPINVIVKEIEIG